MEVAQLATSITTILRLNSMAAEAIALAHDLGHVAFGHAGERALNDALMGLGIARIQQEFPSLETQKQCLLSIALGFGFTHYEQSVRVVDYLEEEYYTRANNRIRGLGLASPVKDGVLKHIRKDFPKQWHKPIYDRILRNFAFRSFEDRPTFLEGQAVAFADYLSYLISDLEDAIRAKIIRFKVMERFRFVGSIKQWVRRGAEQPELPDFEQDVQYQKFKRYIIKFLMLETLNATRERLGSVDEANRSSRYALKQPRNLILPSPDICDQMDEVYEEVIRKRIHTHHLVVAASFKAGRIVKDLFETFMKEPDLVPEEFREANGRAAFDHLLSSVAADECGIDAEQLMALCRKIEKEMTNAFIARDYVAEMSDFLATKTHMRLLLSSESLYA